MTLGTLLRKYRNDFGISMEKLAEYSGLSQPYISQIENDNRKPSIKSLFKLARAIALSTSFEDLTKHIGEVPDVFNWDIEEYREILFNEIIEKAEEFYDDISRMQIVREITKMKYIHEKVKMKYIHEKTKNVFDNSNNDVRVDNSETLSYTDLAEIIYTDYSESNNMINLSGKPLSKNEYFALQTLISGMASMRKYED